MPANNALNVTDINFDTIKSNLKSYLSSQNQFQDYDFEGSAISTIIDLMAYNTYINSVYTNMVGNEMFLDSAQIRNNVVSRAKMLGYVPRSTRGATAYLNITVTPGSNVDSVTIPANTQFTSSVDGIDYVFVNRQTQVANSGLGYSANVAITEGTPTQFRYSVSSSNPVRYVLPNKGVDTTSIKVKVQESASNTQITNFKLATDLTDVNANAAVYFIQENLDEQYELDFGDGVLGKRLRDGNILIIDYQISNGSILNGANTFSGPSAIGGFSNYTFTVSSKAAGGAEQESIESIKFNAPKNFERQGRAVLSEDYKRILIAEAGDLQAVSVWGGEENVPAVYGKVYIAAKPRVGNLLSATRKTELVNLLKTRNILTIEPEFVDASFIYVAPTIKVRYSSARTTLSAGEIFDKVSRSVRSFETNSLNNFRVNFRASQFERSIDNTDPSINSNYSTYRVERRFTPNTNTRTTYSIAFNNAIHHPHDGHLGAVSSTSFGFGGNTCFLDDDGFGNLRIFYLGSNNDKNIVNSTAGTINYETGLVQLDSLSITTSGIVTISIKPAVDDINSVRNQIMLLRNTSIEVFDDTTGVTAIKGASSTLGSNTSILSETSSVISTGATSGVSTLVY